MHPFYYELKKECKDLPSSTLDAGLILAKLNIDEFDENNIHHQKLFSTITTANKSRRLIVSNPILKGNEIERIKKDNIPFLLIDSYGNCMMLPEDLLDFSIMSRFLVGPTLVHLPDELFETLENKNNANFHYFIIYNEIRHKSQKIFAPRVKIFRKFFIENAKYLGSQVKFIEIHNKRTASLCGISEEGVVHHFTNKNDIFKTEGDNIKIFNIDLITNKNTDDFATKYASQVQDNKIDEYMYQSHFKELFSNFTDFIKKWLWDIRNVHYTCEINLLRFYINHFKNIDWPFVLIALDRNKYLGAMKPDEYNNWLKNFIQSLNDLDFKVIITDVNHDSLFEESGLTSTQLGDIKICAFKVEDLSSVHSSVNNFKENQTTQSINND